MGDINRSGCCRAKCAQKDEIVQDQLKNNFPLGENWIVYFNSFYFSLFVFSLF